MTTIDTTKASLTVVKKFTYRGNDEDWSNTYFFDGDVPASPASWHALAEHVATEEIKLYDSAVSIVDFIGHKAGDSVAVWSEDLVGESATIAGTFDASSDQRQSGDTAAWIRWSTDEKTSTGKPIFLRSYYHPCYGTGSGDDDSVATGWKTAAVYFGGKWVSGFLDGDSVNHVRAGPHGVIGLVPTCSQYATTRTLKRRGRRPLP